MIQLGFDFQSLKFNITAQSGEKMICLRGLGVGRPFCQTQ
jgi:hypothetical protein